MYKKLLVLRYPPPHQIFLKRANFEKILLFYLLVQIYTKITKNVNFEILATVTPFLRNENILGLGNPVRKSGTPDYLRSLKMLPIDFSSQKTEGAKFLGHFDS